MVHQSLPYYESEIELQEVLANVRALSVDAGSLKDISDKLFATEARLNPPPCIIDYSNQEPVPWQPSTWVGPLAPALTRKQMKARFAHRVAMRALCENVRMTIQQTI